MQPSRLKSVLSIWLVFSHLAYANKEVISFNVLGRNEANVFVHKVIPIKSIHSNSSLKLVSPHPIKNPHKTVNVWEGFEVRAMLRANHFNLQPNEEIVFVGSDKYVAQLKIREILKHKILIALKRDGNKIEWYDGGPQLVYPNQSKDLPDYLQKDSWWAWAICAIFIGSSPPQLRILSPEKNRLLNLSNRKGNSTRQKRSYPHGPRTVGAPKSDAEVSWVSLHDVFGTSIGDQKLKFAVTTYLGESIIVSGSPTSLVLQFAWNGETISPAFGGPVQLCEMGSQSKCTFFVKSIELVP